MEYGEATVGEARILFDYVQDDNLNWTVTDETPAIIFVVYGEFEIVANRFSEQPPPVLPTVWIVVPLGERGTLTAWSDEEYHLSELGEVHEVPLPLPEFPTPVSLESQS
jgi:hypothetical protein